MSKNQKRVGKLWYLHIVRGVAAVLLGISVVASLVFPSLDTKTNMLIFMAFYWITGGVMSIIWGRQGPKRPGPWIAAGLFGISGGISVLLTIFYAGMFSYISQMIISVSFLITGVVHIVGGFRNPEDLERKWSLRSSFMGIVQVLMGLLIFYTGDGQTASLTILALMWSFLGGYGLIRRGFRLKRLWDTNKRDISVSKITK